MASFECCKLKNHGKSKLKTIYPWLFDGFFATDEGASFKIEAMEKLAFFSTTPALSIVVVEVGSSDMALFFSLTAS